MSGFVDIHSHVLPSVDDGSPSFEVSLKMLEVALGQGVGTMVLTPHLRPIDDTDKEEEHRGRIAELAAAAEQAGLEIELHLGSEIAFRFNMTEPSAWPSGHLAEGRYVLTDLPPGLLSPGLEQGYFELRSVGYKPILAHPERHRQLSQHPEQIDRLRQQDLLLQINAGSLLGRFGRRAQATAEMMLERGWPDFIGSDAHDLEKRPLSLLGEARERVSVLCGEDEVQRLFRDNPACVIGGGEVVRGEESTRRPASSRRAGSSRRRASQRKKEGFFQRLLGRGTKR
jgi:protein-tyrosine phosphatase